ncbi:heparanase-like protein 2 [Gossypium arboreum]|uniref:heparanase-like protein 2 n=1 Tax=Gossypium arboreum TaxID=29729 RepID=UPI0022F1A923|nr:heparanase-like protein 2 [Gossypium arboreum]
MGASVEAEQYGKDIVVLKNLVKELHPDPKTQPKVLGPSGYYDEKWFNSFLEVSGHDVVDGVTHHIYNFGPGDDPNMITKIQDPSYLNQVAQTYKGVLNIVNKYLDPLGMASNYNHKVFCRQTLIGGNYALLNTTTSIPNPDYYGGSKDREEYHLAALAGNIPGQIMLLNDVPMVPTETFNIPAMEPKLINASTTISIAAHSIVYVTIRDFQAPACA